MMIPATKAREILEEFRGERTIWKLAYDLHLSRDFIWRVYNDDDYSINLWRMDKILTRAERVDLWQSDPELNEYYVAA